MDKDTPIYNQTVAEHGDPREMVNEADRVIGQGRRKPEQVVS